MTGRVISMALAMQAINFFTCSEKGQDRPVSWIGRRLNSGQEVSDVEVHSEANEKSRPVYRSFKANSTTI